MNYRKGLSENEWYIMQVLWERGSVGLREICDALQEKKRWTKHAVTSFLKRMLEKGAVGMDESGKVKQYYAVWNREGTVKEETASILDRVYQGNLLYMVSNAVKERVLSPEDIAELKSILDQAGEKRDRKMRFNLLSCRLREPDRGAASCPEQTARQAFAGGSVCAVAASGSPPAASVYDDSGSCTAGDGRGSFGI